MSLSDAFDRYFEVILANSEELREVVFRLRYQVYCVETKFEDVNAYPDQMERDVFDERSAHTLLRHRETGWWAGTVRLVLPVDGNPQALFPAEVSCGNIFALDRLGSLALPRHSAAEVSRFAVSKEFRRRHAEYLSPTGVALDTDYDRRAYSRPEQRAGGTMPSAETAFARPSGSSGGGDGNRGKGADRRTRSEERKVVPHITLGLIQGLVAMSARNGVTHWCAAMERTLLRLLARLGIYFQHVGPLVEYHGKRQPCVADLDNLLLGVKRLHPEIWDVLTYKGQFWPPEKR